MLGEHVLVFQVAVLIVVLLDFLLISHTDCSMRSSAYFFYYPRIVVLNLAGLNVERHLSD